MRRTVALLSLAGLLPIVILGSGFGAATLINERSLLAANVEGRVRYSAALIGRELASDKRAAGMIAQSPMFDHGFDGGRFRILAGRLVANEPEWRRIRVSDDVGRTLAEMPAPQSGLQTGIIDRTSFDWAIAHQRADIGRVVAGRAGTYAFPVRSPVIRGGKVRYVVTIVVPAKTLELLLLDQQLPAGWHAQIVDGRGAIVASTDDRAAPVGGVAASAALSARKRLVPGLYHVARPNGSLDVAMWAGIEATNWTVHVAAPSHLYSAPWHRALGLILVAAIISLGLFLALARLLVRDIKEARAREASEIWSQRMEALGRLTGGIAHDFNNLLTPIVGGLDLLRRRCIEDAKSLKYIDAAIQSADRAKTLIGRLLAYSRRQALVPRPTEVSSLINGLTDLLARSTGPDVVMRIDVPPELDPVFADAAQLELAILNLVINARDAMAGEGRIELSARLCSEPEARERGLQHGRYVAITVADTGSGMDPETLRKATEPFFTTKPAERGTGLGLSMVHGFAAQSNGALHLSSSPGAGTQATIYLPVLASKADDDARARRSGPSAMAKPNVAPKRGRILLVDDEADVRSVAADSLREAGYDVVEASSMGEALERFSEGPFQMLVTDYLMPGGSGGDLIARIRASLPAFPVILVSGYISSMDNVPEDVTRLQKPFAIEALEQCVAALTA